MRSVNNDFVGADEAQHITCLFIQKVQIKVGIGQATREVFHACNLCFQKGKFSGKGAALCVDFRSFEDAIVALDRGKGVTSCGVAIFARPECRLRPDELD